MFSSKWVNLILWPTEISELEKSIKDLEESFRSQKALLAKRKPNYEKGAKESREVKEERAMCNTTRVLRERAQADDVLASGSAASALVCVQISI